MTNNEISAGTNQTQKTSRQLVSELNVIDDIFFHKMVEDSEVCQEILRIILEDDGLEVIEHHPQDSLKNLQGRSVFLDVRCRDSAGKYYEIEVQKANDDDHQRRVRYNGSLLTSATTKVGTDFIRSTGCNNNIHFKIRPVQGKKDDIPCKEMSGRDRNLCGKRIPRNLCQHENQ